MTAVSPLRTMKLSSASTTRIDTDERIAKATGDGGASVQARRTAVVAVAIVASIGLASIYLRLSSPVTPRVILEFVPLCLLFPITAAILIARPANLSAWCLFLAVSLGVLGGFGFLYGLYPGLPVSGSLPFAWPAVLLALSLGPLGGALIPALFLAFPSGRLSRRRATVAGAAMMVPFTATALVLLTPDAPYGPTELAVRVAARTYGPGVEMAFRVAWFAFQTFTIGCGAWVLFNLRKGDAVVRQQGKWLLSGVMVILVLEVSNTVFFGHVNSPIQALLWNGALIFFAICTGVAVTKYRLFDMDFLISKAVLYASIAGVIAVVYTVLVAALGYLGGMSSPSFAVSLAGATGAALVLFPLQERLRHYANLVVFGRRATPYEAMSSFSRAMGEVLGDDGVLPAIAAAVERGTSAEWVQVASVLPGAEKTIQLGEPTGAAHATFDISVSGEKVGKIALRKRRGDVITPTERKLLEDLAAQAGPAVRNVGLAMELQRRLDEISEQAEALHESRQRIVTAQDAERRRIERDLHDGVQQSLVSLAGQLRALSRCLATNPDHAKEVVNQLAEEAKATLEQIRDLAQGVFPQILTDAGVVPALRTHTQKIADNIEFVVDGSVESLRLSPHLEAATYFCCLEALQNVTKHAPNAPAVLSIARADDALVFSVSDLGPGFDPATADGGIGITSMKDRVAAVGGSLYLSSTPGAGTVVTGTVPLTRAGRRNTSAEETVTPSAF